MQTSQPTKYKMEARKSEYQLIKLILLRLISQKDSSILQVIQCIVCYYEEKVVKIGILGFTLD